LGTFAGLGYLDVEAGGAVLSGQGQIGVNGGRGEVTVTGASSRWEMTGSLDVGLYGAGTLAVANGGHVSATDLGTHALTSLGHTASIVTVDGTNSRLEIDATMNVGKGFDISNTGPSSVTVSNGGVVQAGGALTIFSSGTVNVQSGGSLYADVLDRTVGTLNTASGSQLYANQLVGFSGNTIIGGSLTLGHSGGLGGFSVGAGELLFVNRGLVVGLDNGSEAHVTASNGGTIDTAIASIAAFPGSVGEVVVNTGSTWLNVDTIQLGLFGDGTLEMSGGKVQTARLVLGQEGGLGTVNLSAATGLVSISDSVNVGDASDFNLMGGKLEANTVAKSASGAFNFTGGALDVETFDGVLVQDGGTLLIGGSPGAMAVTEDYTFNAGMLEIELGGLTQGTQYDFLEVTGDVNLAGGSLDVSVLSPFTLAAGQVFDILNVGGTLSGEFAGLGQGAVVGNFGGTNLYITYLAGDGNDVALVTTAPILAGDYNNDGVVNAADYTVWRNNFGAPAGTLLNDADGGEIGPAQYATWKDSFGNASTGSGASSSAAVPEPSAIQLLIVALVFVPMAGRKSWVNKVVA
jgi:T5SS/PEP-CTERM-associated repeat protein